MPVTIYIPTPFRHATGGCSRIDVAARTVGEALAAAEQAYPGLGGLVRAGADRLQPHVGLFVNGEPLDTGAALASPVTDGDEIAVIPALAGGAG